MPGPTLVFQLHILLHGVEPAVRRRLLVRGDTSLAELHRIVQIAFAWSDVRGHQFFIGGNPYADDQRAALPESAGLATFGFRPKERFLYHYGLGDEWRHQIRFEREAVLNWNLAPPVCIAGARAGPGEACIGPHDYIERLSRRRGDSPWTEQLYVGPSTRFFRVSFVAAFPRIVTHAQAQLAVELAQRGIDVLVGAERAAFAQLVDEPDAIDRILARAGV